MSIINYNIIHFDLNFYFLFSLFSLLTKKNNKILNYLNKLNYI